MADGVRVANKYLSCAAHGRSVVLPHPKRFEQNLALVVGEDVKAVQRVSDRFHHHPGGTAGRGGQNRTVEHRDR